MECELEGIPFKEIAGQTGETVNTLLSRKRYAVLHLRERLAVLQYRLYAEGARAVLVVLQGIVVRFLNAIAGGAYQWATKAFEGQNASALAKSFPDPVVIPHQVVAPPLVGAEQAVAVLAAYAVFFMLASALLVRARDVT